MTNFLNRKKEDLAYLKSLQKKLDYFDWNLADRIATVELELEHGIDICPTCKNASDHSSPCGRCGTGIKSP